MSNESNVIELARFRILEGAERLLVSERPRMVEALHRRFPGCLAAYLTREDDGGWLDVIVWRSRAEAEEAARMITTIPECAAWFGHISESGGIRHVEVVDAWSATGAGS
ncbi:MULTISPECIES: antibiotic biosynthesis monooxygenase [unclassified Streptomyces]|uniref:Antibiotic biosynthesis monooxygenase n=1 Tax=Streptomyces millisiae TaxID=3075542 RepID=A0ABU2LRW0_9ACTN|nr:antibiotic biosynthesis monooxygenase [Streptomyces sp. DSM 44918]MDT0320324.1 antibiotic biosynthesis monooxygenase [Streptomyces sp. DSM 44918]